MRKHTSALTWQVTGTGGKAVSLTPGSSPQTAVFPITGLPGATAGNMFNYAMKGVFRLDFTVTQSGGTGVALNQDQLSKVVSAIKLWSPILGDVYNKTRTRGVDLLNHDQWFGLGYRPPGIGRAQIPAANGSYTVSLYGVLPLAMRFLARPHDTAIWLPLFENGIFELDVGLSTVLAAESPGCSISAATVRFAFEYVPDPQPQVHTPFQFRLYEHNTGGTQVRLMSTGAANGLSGVQDGARLAVCSWYGNVAGPGLGGVIDPSQITRINLAWRGQDSFDFPDTYMLKFFEAGAKRMGYVSSGAAHDGAAWPYAMSATPNGSLLDANLSFIPLVAPGEDCDLSKMQKVAGDLLVDFAANSVPNGTHRFRTLEFCSFTDDKVAEIQDRMGRSVSSGYAAVPKLAKKNLDSVSLNKAWGMPKKLVKVR